jgi:hypothetical protein
VRAELGVDASAALRGSGGRRGLRGRLLVGLWRSRLGRRGSDVSSGVGLRVLHRLRVALLRRLRIALLGGLVGLLRGLLISGLRGLLVARLLVSLLLGWLIRLLRRLCVLRPCCGGRRSRRAQAVHESQRSGDRLEGGLHGGEVRGLLLQHRQRATGPLVDAAEPPDRST